MTKPTGTSGQGKCGGCALKAHVLIRGDLSDVAVRDCVVGHQPGHWLTKVQAHRVLLPGASEAGSARVIERERAAEQSASVIGQKSAEAVVAAVVLRRRAEREWTRRSRKRLVAGVEPARVSHARRRVA
jgi:hypothetical protein